MWFLKSTLKPLLDHVRAAVQPLLEEVAAPGGWRKADVDASGPRVPERVDEHSARILPWLTRRGERADVVAAP